MSGEDIMEALILSCATGGGHNAAAEAMQEELQCRGHHVQLLDPYVLFREVIENMKKMQHEMIDPMAAEKIAEFIEDILSK